MIGVSRIGVGKSSLILRFVDDIYSEDRYITIGTDYVSFLRNLALSTLMEQKLSFI